VRSVSCRETIESPFFWFSQVIHGTPKPWKFFKIDGLLVNAYEILQNEAALKKIVANKIHGYTEFNGPIMMDSGGFLFMRNKTMNANPLTIMDLYERSSPNLCVVLDHPLDVGLPSSESKRRLRATLRNTRIMVRNRATKNPTLIPVVHGHTDETVKWFLDRLDTIGSFEIYGVGSLVPSVFNAKGIGGIHNAVRVVSTVRKHVLDKKIHVFGVGSVLTMHLMYYAGADSVDSSAWRTKAAFGAIQLPGIGDRYITGKAGKKTHKKYLNISRSEKSLLKSCECSACRRHSLQELRSSFELRALHNAWVFQDEVSKARKFSRKGTYDEYVRETLTRTRFSKAFELAQQLKGI
jgi:tRNA-guanine family transglycosylase